MALPQFSDGRAMFLVVGAACFLVGAMQATVPVMALFVVALLMVPLLFVVEAKYLIAAGVAMALFSRLFSGLGAPSLINYAHFGLAVIILARLVWQHLARRRLMFDFALAGLGTVVLASTLVHGLHGLRPMFFWLTIVEPFLFFALTVDMDARSRRQLRTLLILFAAMQIPFAAVQFALNGLGDGVKGTLLNQGAGPHIIGAVGLIAALLVLTSTRRGVSGSLLLVLPLLAIGVWSDAKQVYGAFAIAALPFAFVLLRGHFVSALPGLAVVFVALVAGAVAYPETFASFSVDEVERHGDIKYEQLREISADGGWQSALLGQGAGNGLSRVALTTVPGYGDVPHLILGDEVAPLALRTLRNYSAGLISSASSPFSSWASIYFDIGVLGLLMYLMLGAWVFKEAGRGTGAGRNFACILIVFAAILGTVFTWLEEPAFTLYLVAAVGCMTAGREETEGSADIDREGIA
jgi:hypothetical protein